jgi:DNA invertase Pin-like site-specific DNA recombinase
MQPIHRQAAQGAFPSPNRTHGPPAAVQGHPSQRLRRGLAREYECGEGISGAKGRDKRPGLDAIMKAVNAKEFEMIAAWSVDRLGRSLTDLLAIPQAREEKGVDLFLHQQGIDTSTTAGKNDVPDVGGVR